jgi:hypothetical protein
MNKKGIFKGRTVVGQPIREGRISNLNMIKKEGIKASLKKLIK